MVELRPLIVVSGTIHADGGKRHKVQRQESSEVRDGRTSNTFVQRREVSKDRRAADVITTSYLRKLRKIRALKTPFGTLVDAAQLGDVKALLAKATEEVIEFNRSARSCKLSNCMIWEPLRGNRLAAVQGWIARQVAESDKRVKGAIDKLTTNEGDVSTEAAG